MVKFLVFADAHYRKGMYPHSVQNLQSILKKAAENQVDFVIHVGDFCNRYIDSPEFVNAYLENSYHLPVYGVYGNHEMEGGMMSYVTPRLSNQKDLVFGTANGKIGDGSVGYYYFDRGGFRFICLDSNYSFNPASQTWEHNRAFSHGPVDGNINGNALAEPQLQWLEKTLNSCVEQGIPAILVSHAMFATMEGWGKNGKIYEHERIWELVNAANAKRKNTVIMAMNGHYHTNHLAVQNGVLCFDVNVATNGWWQGEKLPHYANEHTFELTEYDCTGQPQRTVAEPYNALVFGDNTWFFEKPLSAIVTVEKNGHITVEGQKTAWAYGIAPEHVKNYSGLMPEISSGEFYLK